MRIAAYCRVSTEKEEQLDSLAHQREFFTEYAEKNGHELVRLYADGGLSGTSLKKREAFARLIRDAKDGLFEMVVVKDVSRLARNTVDFLQSIRTLKGLGVNTLFLTANMDSLGESEFVLTLFGAMAQEESANLSKRVKFGKSLNARKGRVPQRIFGYDRVDNFTLAVNWEEAEVVREIYRLYLEEGLGCRTISQRLNQAGRGTKLGCEWNAKGVRRILANSIYCGRYVNHTSEIQDYLTGKRRLLPEEQHFHHHRPGWAVITPETFERAQKQAELRRRSYDAGGPSRQARYSGRHIFSTLIKCDHCGRSFVRKQYTYANTRIYWKCGANDQYTSKLCDNAAVIEEAELLEQLRAYLADRIPDRDAFIESVLKAAEKSCPSQAGEHHEADIERQRKRLLSKRERCQEMYANNVMTMAELKEKAAAINKALEALQPTPRRHPPAGREKEELNKRRREEIEKFLRFETVSNPDLRRVIDYIAVNREGRVRVVLKRLCDV